MRALWMTGLVILATIQVLGCPERWPDEPFRSEAWKASPWDERYVFYNGLAQSRLLEGASRERVVQLLGKPDGKDEPDRVAYLVRKRRMGIGDWHEVKVLEIRFGHDGTVRRYFIRGT